MANRENGIRATPARVAELREEIAELRGELHAITADLRRELRDARDGSRQLAHELATATLRVLKSDAPTKPTPEGRDR